MTIQEIIEMAGGVISKNWIIIVIVLSLVQISPLKINPWSAVGRLISRLIGIKDLSDKIDKVEEKVVALDEKVDKNEAITSRVRILRFGDELRNDVDHTKESFDQILDSITHYDKYCKEHPQFTNSKTVLTTQVIKETYHRLYLERKI